jgi:Anti-sigma factor NepR
MPSRPINTENNASGRLDGKARLKIGEALRTTYDDFRHWELPQRLRELLEQLKKPTTDDR